MSEFDQAREFAMTMATEQSTAWSKLPGIDLTRGVETYLQFLQRQADINREIMLTWTAMMTSISGAVLTQTTTVGHLVAEQAEQVAEQAHSVEHLARGLADRVEHAEQAIDHRLAPAPNRQFTTATGASAIPTQRDHSELLDDHHLLKPEIFEELIDSLLDSDIKADVE